MRPHHIIAAALGLAVLAACQPSAPTVDSTHSTQNSVDWAGRYQGVLPCASCPGIRTELTLAQDGSYSLTETYQGKGRPTTSKGRFSWDASGSVVTLEGVEGPRRFRIGEGRAWQLDTEGRMIEGALASNMILTKV